MDTYAKHYGFENIFFFNKLYYNTDTQLFLLFSTSLLSIGLFLSTIGYFFVSLDDQYSLMNKTKTILRITMSLFIFGLLTIGITMVIAFNEQVKYEDSDFHAKIGIGLIVALVLLVSQFFMDNKLSSKRY